MAASGGGDWTAGIIAIVAALLIGVGLVVGAYFGAYKPRQAQRIAAEQRMEELRVDEATVTAAQNRVKGQQADADRMAERIAALEGDGKSGPFSIADPVTQDVTQVSDDLRALCRTHNLNFTERAKQQTGAQMVYPVGKQIEFEHGLKATGLVVEVQGSFHDFARFLSEAEALESATIIADSVDCIGDSNAGNEHTFILQLYVIEKRNLETLGR